MTTHTQGPWTLTHVGGRNLAVQQFSIRGMFGKSTNVYPIFNKDRGSIDGTDIFCSPGDARLIAAAPELLEALVAITESYADDMIGVENCRPEIAVARAAIAKATGAAS